MKNYYKLYVIPCAALIISLYFLGINFINGKDYVDSPKEKAESLMALKDLDNNSDSDIKSDIAGYDGKVNINTATVGQLMTLEGIGETYAYAIIQKREEIGGFKAIEDLFLVKGIGKSRFEKIKDSITVDEN